MMQENIKNILKNYSKKKYSNDDLYDLVNSIVRDVRNDYVVSAEDIVDILVYHFHMNKDKQYFINININRIKFVDKYKNILLSYVDVSEDNSSNSDDNEDNSDDNEDNSIDNSNDNNGDNDTDNSNDNDDNDDNNDNDDNSSDSNDNNDNSSNDNNNDSSNNNIFDKEDDNVSNGIVQFSDSDDDLMEQKIVTSTINVHNATMTYTITKRTDEGNGPYGTSWINDKQEDDILTNTEKSRAKQFKILRNIVLPPQRSDEWFKMRNNKITASDGGCVLGENHYEPMFKFVLKKIEPTFQHNAHCYHGKKYEQIATMIYEYRMNVNVEEFGLLGHPKYDFLGASPDGICSYYKHDKKHLSKYVGRMLEIKCPVSRSINKTGKIKGNICPDYYWVQVQLQLECCDLDECDFWQCSIYEYDNREEFINDTCNKEQFRSKITGYEKGCLVQLLPKEQGVNVFNNPGNYLQTVYEHATFIYPEKIEMTLTEVNEWVANTIDKVEHDPEYQNYYVDRVVYWRLADSHNVLILRDKEWFNNSLQELERVWSYVVFFRDNMDKFEIFKKYLSVNKYLTMRNHSKKMLEDISNTLRNICNPKLKNYNEYIKKILNPVPIKSVSMPLCKAKKINEYSEFRFDDD